MPLSCSPRWRLALILGLYAYQGLAAGFALTALPNHFAVRGLASTAEVGLHIALTGLPWVAQPLWGPLVDRFGGLRMGRRRPWVLMAQAGALLSLLPLLGAEPGSLAALAPVFLAHGAFAALMDTAADGWIMDRVPPDALGTATACTRVGFVGGIAVGSALFGVLLPALGLRGAAAVLLTMGGALALLPLLIREAPGDALLSLRTRPSLAMCRFLPLLAELARELRHPCILALLVFCAAQDFAGAAFRVPLGVALLGEGGWTAEALSAMQGTMALVAGTVGALLVGWWTDSAGASRSLPILLAAAAAAHLLAALLLPAGLGGGALAMGLSVTTSALAFVALAPAVMRTSAGPVAATRFALYMAALNTGDVVGAAAAPGMAATLGLAGTALTSAATLLALAFLTRPMLRFADSARVAGTR
ncbi:MFS transporter [Sabulicella glaciei]|uniref:MFS transporter n=1 Tax=Sabulicella glaciei TaxID=2984948 RepID=A0ABT3NU65_9PROT|nr:MFS transporter [Roseococcus sp. MDT2-1-1]MCW8085701.1 MFS transporter [Roseococcus sp. MDT2-1-1]